MSYQLEVDCIAAAHQMDLLTSPYAFNPGESRLMTQAGADLVVAHMGLTASGAIGARTTKTLADCVRDVQAIIDTCKSLRADVLVLCHGGPIATPADARFLLDSCRGLDGFYGASSMERLPTETAITEQVRKFSTLQLRQERPPAADKTAAFAQTL
jgi:predicted TIM-barrel enzyme